MTNSKTGSTRKRCRILCAAGSWAQKPHRAMDVEESPIVIDGFPADVRNRDGAANVIIETVNQAVTVEALFADCGSSGKLLPWRSRNWLLPTWACWRILPH